MAYISWATNVNKVILDSSTVKVGEGAVAKDELESGGIKRSRLVSANPPDTFSVTMDFNCVDKGPDGYTELERFYIWYKWIHKYGVNPFRFPAILINSNRQSGYSKEERQYLANQYNNAHSGEHATSDDIPDYEYYCITSAIEGQKSGNDLRLTMTWETYATGAISIPEPICEIDHIEPENGVVAVIMTSTPTLEPTPQTWKLYIDGTRTIINNCIFDGTDIAYLYFDEIQTAGSHTVKVDDVIGTFEV